VSTATRPSPKLAVAKDITIGLLDKSPEVVYIRAIVATCDQVGIGERTARKAIARILEGHPIVRSRNGAGWYLHRANAERCACTTPVRPQVEIARGHAPLDDAPTSPWSSRSRRR
jgi:hypothetical protein